MGWVHHLNIGPDLRYAFRGLRNNPGFAIAAVLVLALGIGANTAVFTVVNGVLLRPLPFPDPAKLLMISYSPRAGPFGARLGLSDQHYLEFRRKNQLFEHVAAFAFHPVTLTGAADPVRVRGAAVTPDFFQVLRMFPTNGRMFLQEEDQQGRNQVAILSDRLWRSRFAGDLQILGKPILLDGIGHSVIGIMPAGFALPYDAELWTPLEIRVDPRNSLTRPVVGRLKPGSSPAQAQAELEAFAKGLPGESGNDSVARIVPLLDWLVGDARKPLLIFSGAVAFVLLIACANVANLILTRAASRRQEITVRVALGASRWRLIRQLLTESMLVSLGGGAAGMLLALWGVPALLALAPAGRIPRADQVHLDGWILVFTFGLSVLTGAGFGLLPALQATRRGLRQSLSEGARTLAREHDRFRSALVISEIALSLVLLIGAGLLLKSFLRMSSVDQGFRTENLLTMNVNLPDSRYRTAAQTQAFHDRMLVELSRLPGAASAAAVNWIPLGQTLMRGDFQLEGGRRLPPRYFVDKTVVSPGYFHTMGIRLLTGREFTERDNAAAPGVVIVTQAVARRVWPGEDPIGKRIALENRPTPEDWLAIVGVVDDIRQHGWRTQPSPAIYQPYLQVKRPFWLSRMSFVVRTSLNPGAAAPSIRSILRDIDRDLPAESISTMETLVAGTTAEPRFQARLLGAFSVLALLLAAIGIYGVLSCSVAERTHEIGIRMALGAGQRDIVLMVLRRTLILAGIGVTLGAAAALAVTRILAKLLFEVKPTDPVTFVVVAAILIATAIMAALLPARRASTVYPVIALRHD